MEDIMNRRTMLAFGAAALFPSAFLLAGRKFAYAQAQEWPAKPVRIIETYPAGVARDNRTRVIADKLSSVLPQRVYVDNRPGASGRIGLSAAAKSAPDGYTFSMIGPGDLIMRHLFELPYDIERDFDAVSMVEILPVVAVARASLSVQSVAELVRYAKEHPGELKYGSPGIGSFHHMNGTLFANLTGTTLRHVPYGQGNPGSDLLGGHIDLVFDALPPWLENIKAGRLRALATTGEQRATALPEVPTFKESGLGAYEVYALYGVVAPKGTPASIIGKFQAALSQVVHEPSLFQQWTHQGGNPVASTASEFAARIRSESDRWGKVIRSNDIRISP
jgi:tripartite-type tricarboxylate transporter receptor subunit TctC